MRSPVVPVVVLALIAVPLFAQSNDVAVWIGSSRVGTTNTGGSDIHFDRGNAIGVSLDHFFSNHYSAEVGLFNMRHDGTLRIGGVDAFDIGKLKMTALTGMLQWHAERWHPLDPYVGGGLAYVRANDIHSADLDSAGVGSVNVKSRVGWAAVLGASYTFRKPLAVAAEARYIGYRPQSGPRENSVKLQLSPLVYSIGLRWRF